MKSVRIREAVREDRGAIDRLVEAGSRDARKRIGPHPCPVPMENLGVRGCLGLVAELDGRVIGNIGYRIRGRRLHFFNLVVEAKHRRNGVARRLVQELEIIAEQEGAKHATVQTIAELGVGPFFESLGYRPRSAKREFLYAPERERALTTVYMVKRLGRFPGEPT